MTPAQYAQIRRAPVLAYKPHLFRYCGWWYVSYDPNFCPRPRLQVAVIVARIENGAPG